MKKKIIFYSIFVLCLISFLTPTIIQAQPIRNSLPDSYSVNILEAYYVDVDIYTKLELLSQTQSTAENYYLQVTLLNPIGEEATILLRVMTHSELLILDIVFYNYATVSGDYTILASIISNNRWYAETDIVIFDPPSGGSEGDPYIGISVR
jgi:hypothetical protein